MPTIKISDETYVRLEQFRRRLLAVKLQSAEGRVDVTFDEVIKHLILCAENRSGLP